jgi:flagellar basal-body rod protein FlgF
MVIGLYTSAGGMLPRIVQQESIATNLANASTNGYKKGSIFLRTLIDADSALDHAQGKNWNPRPENLRIDYTQGSFNQTGNPLDIALNGPGFMRVSDSAGKMFYTRDGRFHLNPGGYLANGSGMLLLDDTNKPIRIQGTMVALLGDGTVRVDDVQVARIGLTDFKPADYLSLQSLGMGLFRKPSATAEKVPGAATLLQQGYLEDSNVEPVQTMVDMIETFRTFEMGQKSIQIQDQSLQRVVTELGSVR